MAEEKKSKLRFDPRRAVFFVANEWINSMIRQKGAVSNGVVDAVFTAAQHFVSKIVALYDEKEEKREDPGQSGSEGFGNTQG